MPAVDRDSASFTGSLRHKASASSDVGGRALVPMWDSSDPDRAPPPLPLNPQSPGMLSRTGVSSAIQSAHLALSEKAREANMGSSSAISRRSDLPENIYPPGTRPLPIPGVTAAHRRMQSLQPTVRDRSVFLEGMPPPKPSEKGLRPTTPNHGDLPSVPPIIDNYPVPGPGPSLTPIIRPVARRTHQSILGENTPPQSATMMALNNLGNSVGPPPLRETEKTPTPPQDDLGMAPPPATEYSESPRGLNHSTSHHNLGQMSPAHSQPQTHDTGLGISTGSTINDQQHTPKARAAERARPSFSDGDVFCSSTSMPDMHNTSQSQSEAFSFSDLGHHIMNLTKIASQLQKDMSALSRRSRDNAADLLSLKQATNARDEDIRKGLRNLIENVDEVRRNGTGTKDVIAGAHSLLQDVKVQQTSSPQSASGMRSFHPPRIPTPNSFATSLDRESASTPSLYGQENPQVLSLLERIVREMSTKEGQENLINRLAEVADRLHGMPSAGKIGELIEQLRLARPEHGHRFSHKPASETGSVRSRVMSFESNNVHDSLSLFNPEHASALPRPASSEAGSTVVTDDVLKVIHSVKDSVAQGGGLTAEVKALVRELRGEILGMGREIGRRLDELDEKGVGAQDPLVLESETNRIIHEGLEDLKDQMDILLQDPHRRSSADMASGIDYQEIYNAMRAALKDNAKSSPGLTQDDVVVAVRDAWENYEPKIHIQQFGLARDEIFECLKQGMAMHADQALGATRDEVYQAVADGLKHFVPPHVDSAASLSREEILDAVRECLEEFEFPVAPGAMGGGDMTREEITHAVREGLRDMNLASNAMAAANGGGSSGSMLDNAEVLEKLCEIVEMLRSEFTAVSLEAKQNVTSNGRDTEHIIDSTRSALDKLRYDIEGYIDRVNSGSATSATRTISDGSESPVNIKNLSRSLDKFRDDINHMLHSQTESLRDTVNMSLIPAAAALPSTASTSKEVLEAVRDGVDTIRNELRRPLPGTTEILDALHEGLGDLHLSIDRIRDKPADLTANDEILDALKAGLNSVRLEISELRDAGSRALVPTGSTRSPVPDSGSNDSSSKSNDEMRNVEYLISKLTDRIDKMSPLGAGASPRIPEALVRPDDIRHLELLMGDLRQKIDTLTEAQLNTPVPDPQEIPLPDNDHVRQEDIQNLEFLVTQLHEKFEKLSETQGPEVARSATPAPAPAPAAAVAETPDDHAKQEDIKSLELIITKLHDKVETATSTLAALPLPAVAADASGETSDKSLSSADVERIISTMASLKEAVESMASRDKAAAEEASEEKAASEESEAQQTKLYQDVEAIETILRNTKSSLDDFVSGDKTVRKEHVDKLEALLLETRQSLSTLTAQMESISRREDVYTLQALISQMSARHDQAVMSGDRVAGDGDAAGAAAAAAAAAPVSTLGSPPLAGFGMQQSFSTHDDISNLSNSLRTSMSVLAESHSMSVVNRQTEMANMAQNFADIKTLVGEFRTAVEAKVGDGFSVVDAIAAAMEKVSAFSEKNENIGEMLREFGDAAKVDFDETRTSIATASAATDEKLQQAVDALTAKLEAMQQADEERGGELKTQVAETSKTLGDALSAVDEAGKAMSGRVDDLVTRSDEDRTEAKTQHELTRSELKEAIDGVREPVTELQPIIAVAIKEVLDKAAEHHTLSQDVLATLQTRVDDVFNKPDPTMPDPYDDTELKAKMDAIAASEADVLVKLGSLVDDEAGALAQLAKLDTASQETHKRLDAIAASEAEALAKTSAGIDEAKQALDKLATTEAVVEISGKMSAMDETLTKKLDSLADCDLLMQDRIDKVDAGLCEKLEALAKLDRLETLETTVGDKLAGLETALGDKLGATDSAVGEKLSGLDTRLAEGLASVGEKLAGVDSLVGEKLTEVGKTVGDQVNEAVQKLVSAEAKIAGIETAMADKVGGLDSSVTTSFATMHSTVTDGFSKADAALTENFATLNSQVTERFGSVDAAVAAVGEQVSAVGSKITEELAGKMTTAVDAGLTEKLSSLDSGLSEKITSLDSGLSEKLTGLDSTVVDKLGRLDALEKMQAQMNEQMQKTAADMAAFMAAQTQRATDEAVKMQQDVMQASVQLAQRAAEKEGVEATISALRDEETRLRDSVIALRAEHELMLRQRTKLTADVSSLETALGLRRDELREMEERAEGLERRIMEGVMDHSRILLMAKSSRSARDAMSRKRVGKADGRVVAGLSGLTAASMRAVFPAVKAAKGHGAAAGSKKADSARRRIASLGQIDSFLPAGHVKRSHSVKAAAAAPATAAPAASRGLRKGSWGGVLSKKTANGGSAAAAAAVAAATAAAAAAATAVAVSASEESDKSFHDVDSEEEVTAEEVTVDEDEDDDDDEEFEEVEANETILKKDMTSHSQEDDVESGEEDDEDEEEEEEEEEEEDSSEEFEEAEEDISDATVEAAEASAAEAAEASAVEAAEASAVEAAEESVAEAIEDSAVEESIEVSAADASAIEASAIEASVAEASVAEASAVEESVAEVSAVSASIVSAVEELVAEDPEDEVEDPEDEVEDPEDEVEDPEDEVEDPEDEVEDPEDEVEDPEDEVEDPEDEEEEEEEEEEESKAQVSLVSDPDDDDDDGELEISLA